MHHIDLNTLTLASGGHSDREQGVCFMEAIAWWAGQEHTDAPPCVSPVLRSMGIALNDRFGDAKRQDLKAFIPLLPGTAGDGLDETRGYLALDWLVRTWTPAWLDLAGLTGEAAELRELRRIVDLSAAQAAGPVVRGASQKAVAAWAAARDAAAAAAADAAAAAAWDAAAAAAADAARDAARAAAAAAAWDAAWDAAAAAAAAAARDAAGDKLRPTVEAMQNSIITLYGRMVKPDAA